MRRSRKPIVIASRTSPLARVQAQRVGQGLQRLHPELEVKFIWVESKGDQIVDVPLADVGGKGLFTNSVEEILIAKEADIAVHSMKDMPADEITPGLQIAAIPKRADVRDVLLGSTGPLDQISLLPQGGRIGTSSPRRASQLLAARPDLQIELIRGNVGTRIDKVKSEGGPDATMLAAAGLFRLGMTDLIGSPLEVEQMLPAACQGALGIQCRSDDHISLTRCLPLNNPAASTSIHAERQLVAGLGANCHSPIAVLAHQIDPKETQAVRNVDSHWFRLRAKVMSSDGSQCLEIDEQCKTQDLRRVVKQVVKDLTAKGAKELLASAGQ